MLMSSAFLASALIQFALGLVIAAIVGPEVFGLYALGLAGAIWLQNLAFEWLRLAATRFYHPGDASMRDARLLRLMAAIALGVIVAAALAALALAQARLLALLIPAIAIAAGFVDLRAALMRARFDERGYALLLLLRNGLAIVLLPMAAALTGSAEAVLAAYLATLMLAGLAAGSVARPAMSSGDADRRAAPAEGEGTTGAMGLLRLLGYSAPIVATNALYLALFFGLRSAIAYGAGLAAAGQASLAIDFVLKLVTTIGTALDLTLFQYAVRADRAEGAAAGLAVLRRNAERIIAILAPMGAGLALVVGALETLLVASAFRGAFGAFVTALVPGVVLYGVIQYALHPFLQIRQQTAPLVLAAAAGLGAGTLALALGALVPLPLAVHAGLALFLAMAASGAALVRAAGIASLPSRGFAARLGLALAAMSAAVWGVGALPAGQWALPLAVGAGALVYAASALALDLAGSRSVWQALRRRA